MKNSKQVNMAVVVAASAVANASASSAVSVKEANVLAAIASNRVIATSGIATACKVDPKSVPGIVASLNKKGFVVTEKTNLGTLVAATADGVDAAALLS
jgi:DNA-binding MarR family transcriptional regulator